VLSSTARAAHPNNPRRALARTLSSTEREVVDLKTAFSYHRHIVHVVEDKVGEAALNRMTKVLSEVKVSSAFSGIDTPIVAGVFADAVWQSTF
jgi:hypothetical protein